MFHLVTLVRSPPGGPHPPVWRDIFIFQKSILFCPEIENLFFKNVFKIS